MKMKKLSWYKLDLNPALASKDQLFLKEGEKIVAEHIIASRWSLCWFILVEEEVEAF